MALMFGGANAGVDTTLSTITKTINYLATQTGALPKYVKKENDGSYVVSTSDTKGADEIEVTWYKEDAQGSEDKATEATAAGERFIGQFTVSPTAMRTIEVDAAHFPGTYKIVGETYARNDANGEDEFFQFIIYKAKISSENTITLQAEGDPSTFNFNLTVLRNQDGKMMDLVQYKI